MNEDFNENEVKHEDNQCVLNNRDLCTLCDNDGDLIECPKCNLKFCNEIHGNESCSITHLKTFSHYIYKLKTKKNIYEEIKCGKCGENNIQLLFIYINNENNEIELDIEHTIFCKNHSPEGSEPIISYIKEEEEKEINDKLIVKENNTKQNNFIKDKKKMERQELLIKFKDIGFRTYNNVKEKYGSKYEYYKV